MAEKLIPAIIESICPDVNYRTLQHDLKEMLEKELVTSAGATYQLVYIFRV